MKKPAVISLYFDVNREGGQLGDIERLRPEREHNKRECKIPGMVPLFFFLAFPCFFPCCFSFLFNAASIP